MKKILLSILLTATAATLATNGAQAQGPRPPDGRFDRREFGGPGYDRPPPPPQPPGRCDDDRFRPPQPPDMRPPLPPPPFFPGR